MKGLARKYWVIIWAVAALGAATAIGLAIKYSNRTTPNRSLSVKEVTPEILNQGFARSVNYTKTPAGVVTAGIVPHHMLVAPMVAGFFTGLKNQTPPETVVIIGPDHQDAGRDQIVTETSDWLGPNGKTVVNSRIINKLIENNLAVIDESTLSNEYGVNSLVPFINQTWPATKVVLFALRSNVGRQQINNLANFFIAELNKTDLIVASVDLSHYQTLTGAWDDDAVTLPIIRSMDVGRTDKIIADSPAAVALILEFAKKQGLKYQELVHTNSAEYLGDLSIGSNTSYLSAYFYQ